MSFYLSNGVSPVADDLFEHLSTLVQLPLPHQHRKTLDMTMPRHSLLLSVTLLLAVTLLPVAPAGAQADPDATPLELVSRIGTEDPIVTAAEASKVAFIDGADTVLVASVEDFADALFSRGAGGDRAGTTAVQQCRRHAAGDPG